MADGLWKRREGWERPVTDNHYAVKRPRLSYDIPSDRASSHVARDSNPTIPFLELTPMSPGFGGQHQIPPPLPLDASPTLFVEGIPATTSRREVSHIFRPFLGYKDVRLVSKELQHSLGERLVLCFVDFESPARAATAMGALQGYKFDEHERDSAYLRIEFAHHSGARVGNGHRGKH